MSSSRGRALAGQLATSSSLHSTRTQAKQRISEQTWVSLVNSPPLKLAQEALLPPPRLQLLVLRCRALLSHRSSSTDNRRSRRMANSSSSMDSLPLMVSLKSQSTRFLHGSMMRAGWGRGQLALCILSDRVLEGDARAWSKGASQTVSSQGGSGLREPRSRKACLGSALIPPTHRDPS